jgi:hypothetical protein
LGCVRQSLRALAAVALAVVAIFGCMNASAASISPSVSPSRGSFNTEYAFLVRYSGQLNVSSAEVYINGAAHPMTEADAADQNFTNGKDYTLVTRLPEGSNVYYFLVVDSNGTEYRSAAGVVVVDPWINLGHFDVALAVMLFMIPLFYVMYLMRRATKALEKVAKRLESEKSAPCTKEPAAEKPDSPVKESEIPPKQG